MALPESALPPILWCSAPAAGGRLAAASSALRAAVAPALLLGRRRLLAVRRLARWARALNRPAERWMDAVLRHSIDFHCFPNRMKVNVPRLVALFSVGLAEVPELAHKTRFWRGPLPRCPRCGEGRCTSAVLFAVGDRMCTSSPCLHYSCTACLRVDRSRSDYYYAPLVFFYGSEQGRPEPEAELSGADSDSDGGPPAEGLGLR